jgi:hypothetical protein
MADAAPDNLHAVRQAAAAHATASAAKAAAASVASHAAEGAASARIAARAAPITHPEGLDFDRAFAADASVVDRGSTGSERALLASDVAGTPLWPGQVPASIVEAWARSKAVLLAANEGWEVWINWYEDRLAGRAADSELEVARATLPDDIWEKGPNAVNAEIRRLIAESSAIRTMPEQAIPQQGAGAHFTFGPGGLIALALLPEVDAVGNNLVRIRDLLPLVRHCADDLAGHLNPNAYPELTRNVADYRAAIAGDDTPIAWGLVFGLGVMLENSAEAARRRIENMLQPPLEDVAQSALDSLLELHGPLILATAEGRELADQASRMRLTREEQQRLREDAKAVAGALEQDKEVIERPAAKLVSDSAKNIGDGRHPERGTVFGIGTIGNLAIGLVGVAAVSATLGIGVVESGAAFVAVEALKKSAKFSAVTSMLGRHIDRVFGIGAAYRRFVTTNEEPLRRIAANTPQLRWMVPHIEAIVRADATEPPQLPKASL